MGNNKKAIAKLLASAKDLPNLPGIYHMLDANERVIYVGKAKNLRKRVRSYFVNTTGHVAKVKAMVSVVKDFTVTATLNETEALILESQQIKQLRPRYNVLLRDDKSYPYICVDLEEDFPRLEFHRGAKKLGKKYFGPFPNSGSVRDTLALLEKLFLIRQCDDSVFRNRSRPCLQHQIKRCSAPCVGLIARDEYKMDVQHASLFLEGKSEVVIELLLDGMKGASRDLNFERAAQFRDQIESLRSLQLDQSMEGGGGDCDVIAAAIKRGIGCVQIFFIRHGRVMGNKAVFPKNTSGASLPEIINAFITQFYLIDGIDRDIPKDIIVSERLEDGLVIGKAMSSRFGKSVKVRHQVRGDRANWIKVAQENATLSLDLRIAKTTDQSKRMKSLEETINFLGEIKRIECFDISHLGGESTVASCICFGLQGPIKDQYRKFNIRDAAPGDDYAAMYEALSRRYGRLKKEGSMLPDLLVIDGGKGQVTQANKVLRELEVQGITVIGIAKGPSRKPGLETIVMHDTKSTRVLESDSPALHLLQHVRDEAHRFAIEAHRLARSKVRRKSPLETIPGIGSKRRHLLIQYFGGSQGIKKAGISDLIRVPGISKDLARKIFENMNA
jgi:excinuclease ABC subunit C